MVYDGDNAEDVANAFCSKHRLAEGQREQLVVQIREALDDELRSRQQSIPGIADSQLKKSEEAVGKNNETISENVDEDDISEHNNIGGMVNRVPVMDARLYSRSLGRVSHATPSKSIPTSASAIKGHCRSDASAKQPPKHPQGRRTKGISTAATSGHMTVRPADALAAKGGAASPEERMPEMLDPENSTSGKLKRGASLGDFGRGLRLYENGRKTRANLERQAREREKERKQKEMEGVTFRPAVNHPKCYLQSREMQKRPEERMLAHVRRAKERQDIVKNTMHKEGVAECTFHPEINKRFRREADSPIGARW